MSVWVFVAVVGWASFQIGQVIAMSFRPRVQGARGSPVSSTRIAAAVLIVIAAVGFFAWNQTSKLYPFTFLHAGILAACVVFGYQSILAKQSSLQNDINAFSSGVSKAFSKQLSSNDRVEALLAVAMQDPLLGSKFSIWGFRWSLPETAHRCQGRR